MLSASTKKFSSFSKPSPFFSSEFNPNKLLKSLHNTTVYLFKGKPRTFLFHMAYPSFAFPNGLALKKCKRKINFVTFSTFGKILFIPKSIQCLVQKRIKRCCISVKWKLIILKVVSKSGTKFMKFFNIKPGNNNNNEQEEGKNHLYINKNKSLQHHRLFVGITIAGARLCEDIQLHNLLATSLFAFVFSITLLTADSDAKQLMLSKLRS